MKEKKIKKAIDNACLSKIELPDDCLDKIISWMKDPKYFLVFCGNPGVGKTYLCHAINNFRKDAKKYCWYLKEQELFSKLRDVIKENQDYTHKVREICENEFLILDDLCSSTMTDWQKEVLFTFVDERCENCLPTVITSNLYINKQNFDKKSMLTEFSSRFVSRMSSARNMIIELEWKDKRQDLHEDD